MVELKPILFAVVVAFVITTAFFAIVAGLWALGSILVAWLGAPMFALMFIYFMLMFVGFTWFFYKGQGQ